MSAKILATGVEALKMASRLAEFAHPIQQSGYNIPVGTLDSKQKMLIVGIVGFEIVYLHQDKLKSHPTHQFLHGYMIGQVAAEVYRRTAWIIPASRIMFSFMMGVTIGYVGTAAVAANVIVMLIRIGALISAHPGEVDQLKVNLPKVVRSVRWLRAECPVLYSKLGSLVNRGVWEAIASAPAGISSEDVASVLGRILGGVTALGEVGETGLKVVAKVVAKTLVVYSGLHFPAWAAKGAVSGADQLAKAFADELRAQRIALTPQEEVAIAKELSKSAQAVSQLTELQTALNGAAPALDKLVSAFAKGTL